MEVLRWGEVVMWGIGYSRGQEMGLKAVVGGILLMEDVGTDRFYCENADGA